MISIFSVKPLAFVLFAFVTILCFSDNSFAQRRDFMTDEEIEIVRDSQFIDERIDVLIKMIDRRFAALGVEVGGWKQAEKESEKWGAIPKSSRLELFVDIKKLLQKAIDDIDNLAANPDTAPVREKGDKRAKTDHQLFPKAVRNLATAATRYLPPLNSELSRTAPEVEKGPILDSIEFCNQIIEAAGRLPAEAKKSKN